MCVCRQKQIELVPTRGEDSEVVRRVYLLHDWCKKKSVVGIFSLIHRRNENRRGLGSITEI